MGNDPDTVCKSSCKTPPWWEMENPAGDQTSLTLVKHKQKDVYLIDVSDLSNSLPTLFCALLCPNYCLFALSCAISVLLLLYATNVLSRFMWQALINWTLLVSKTSLCQVFDRRSATKMHISKPAVKSIERLYTPGVASCWR
jgi:hypothetical protein